MLRVYNYMASGLVLTGIVAYAVGQHAVGWSRRSFGTPLQLGGHARAAGLRDGAELRHQQAVATAPRRACSGRSRWSMGASLASIFLVFTGASIARVFFITAGTFGAMSLYGYTTKSDLSQFGSFLIMGLIGIIIASLVNIFIGSHRAAVRDLGDRRAGVRRPHRLRHAADQGDVRRETRRRDGRQEGASWARCRSTSTSSTCS